MPELPVDEPIRVVPDWVCEILSKSTRRHDLLIKMPYYARVGIACAWVVDLDARVLTAHRLESGAWRIIGTYSDETEARIEPFDVVPLNVVVARGPSGPRHPPFARLLGRCRSLRESTPAASTILVVIAVSCSDCNERCSECASMRSPEAAVGCSIAGFARRA